MGDCNTANKQLTTVVSHIKIQYNSTKSWEAYPSGTTTDGLFNGDVLYPLIDHGNTYDEDGVVEQSRIAVGGSIHFTNQNEPIYHTRFKPMVRAKYLWDKIFETAGFTYTSIFLNDDLFRKLYVSAFGNEALFSADANVSSRCKITIENTYQFPLFNVAWLPIPLDNVTGFDGSFDFGNNYDLTTYRYEAPFDGDYTFTWSLRGFVPNPAAGTNFTIRYVHYDASTASNTILSTDVISSSNIAANGLWVASHTETNFTLGVGDLIYAELQRTAINNNVSLEPGSLFQVTDGPGEMNLSYYLDCDKKQIDFVKDIITKFRLVLTPDKNDTSNFIIEPWQDYIGSGDEFDWTDKLDVSKDFKISPLFYTQTDKIIFTDKEDGDFLNETYYNQFNEVFGTLNAIANNELLKGDRKIETTTSPTPVTQIEGANQNTGGGNNHGFDNTIIPQIHTHSSEDTGVQHLPIKPNTRYMFYNGMKDTGIIPATTNPWWVYDENLVKYSHTNYPMVSDYSDFPIENDTIYLNWQKEEGYINYDLLDITKGVSVYDYYWNTYIQSLYDKWARRVTAYFVLNSQDLQDFSFDDVIFVKDTYYYVEKIYDVPLGEKASVKVDLIKLLNR